MRVTSLLVVAAIVVAAGCAGGGGSPDPRTLPVRFEVVGEPGRSVTAGDLDGDGYDELVSYDVELTSSPAGMEAIWLYNSHRELIDQLNYQGQVLTPQFADIDDDTVNELLVPFVRNDSLFVSVVDELGRKQFGFFLVAGASRREPNGVIPWDPKVQFFAEDVDGDRASELIMHINTGYARYPRGVAVFDLPNGIPIGSHFTGAKASDVIAGHLDEDGRFDLVVAAWAARNGAAAGGFDDDHAYVMAYEFGPEPLLTWSREIRGRWGYPAIAMADLDGNLREELLLCTTTINRAVQIHVMDPGTWRVRMQRMIDEPLRWCRVLDVDGDARVELVFLHGTREIWIVDEEFEIIRRTRLPWEADYLRLVPDVDGDGSDEVAALRPGRRSILLLGTDLTQKAIWEGRIISQVRRGRGQRPHFLGVKDGFTYVLDPVPNPFFWIYRYGPRAGLAAVAVLLLAGGTVGRRWVLRARLNEALHARLIDQEQKVWLVVDERGRLVESSTGTHVVMNGKSGHDAALSAESPLGHFVYACLGREPAQRCEGEVSDLGPGEREARVTVEPLPLRRLERRLWLVRVDFEAIRQRHSDVSVLLAQRVAHDIKNPLTSILLTLQRLQMEYQERAPALGEALDPYTERIIERIEQLRRMTRNFLKVVDQERPSFKTLDLSQWLEARTPAVRQALPPDIDLVQQLESALPPVHADPDQLEDVLTNLVTNAVEAMPEGGALTLSTGLAYGLLLPAKEVARDYVVLEVLDTGVGLAYEDRERIFAPGYTQFENGTGLGLALVRKIVDDHEGHIEVDGEPGVGAAFTIYFPAAEKSA